MLRTSICDLLGIEYPIIQGGMAHIATAELASAVSGAGGAESRGEREITGDRDGAAAERTVDASRA